ncbi:TOMM precursor leader peptide-binding protein [Tateyamaria pelophila]|uniref:TOMM precursor leader peptide-binding protein n=1 Tax=Tateyamaria pelophila TaxID=328415 RepID=UPI001CBFA1EB|nr:TOMM precursor leader peptide-binding protein [Tateyamaria pelophila]
MDSQARERPRFKTRIQPVVDADDGLFLLWEGGAEWLPNSIFCDLAPLLDGRHRIGDIFSRLSERHAGASILAALQRLENLGVLAEDTADVPRSTAAFWEQANISPGQATHRLAQNQVKIMALGQVSGDALADLLEQQGLHISEQGAHTIVITDDYLHPELPRINQQFIDDQQPWLLVKPHGAENWIGPAITPHQSACWACLAHRLRWHRRVERYAIARNGITDGAQPGHLPSTSLTGLAEAATAMTGWIGTGTASALENCVMSTNTLTFERTRHHLIRRPHCPACGTVAVLDRSPAPIILKPRPKIVTSDGGHRGSDPAETARRLERHLSPITGVVGAVDPGSRTHPAGCDARWLTPTFSADHNFSDMHDTRFVLRDGMRRRSGGKGKTAAQARVSALAESLERYCGVFDGTEPRCRARARDLGAAALRPNDCMLYSETQFANRDHHNLKEHKAHWVPEPFDREAEIEWTPMWSLTHQQRRYLPTSMCYFGYQTADPVFGRGDSNGCAVGSVMEEAILQGLLELVERDAVAIWWYNRVQRPGVDLTSADDPYVADLVAHYATLGRSIWVLDVTGDLGIPTFAALSKRIDTPEEDIIYGFGCHLDPTVALTRAITEINQSLDAVPALHQPETQNSYLGSQEAVAWWRTVRTRDNPYLVPDAQATPVDLKTAGNHATDDLARDVEICVERLKSVGIEVVVLDQSRPDVEFPAVRVVAPGLRHFWARFGPGRLYDVPVDLGWLQSPKTEASLNSDVVQF